MSSLRAVLRELMGLFVDDEFLCIGVLVVIAATAAFAAVHEVAAEATLVAGIPLVLAACVHRSTKRASFGRLSK